VSTPPQHPDHARIVVDAVTNQMLQVTVAYVDLARKLIITTEDKVRLCLIQRQRLVDQQHEWVAPAGILVALILTLTTSTFHDFLLPRDTWLAIFIIALLLCLAWLLRSLWRLRKAPSIDDVVEQLKKSSVVTSEGSEQDEIPAPRQG